MILKAFDKAEINTIYKKKVFFSILKYNKNEKNAEELGNIDVFKAVLKRKSDATKKKYNVALNYCEGNTSYKEYDDIVKFLDEEELKYNDIRKENKEVLDMCSLEILRNLYRNISELDNDIDKCRLLVEYVSRSITHNKLSTMYNHDIPYGDSYYYFEFSNDGVPVGYKVRDLLVLKTGSPNDVTGLMEYLGSKFDLPIKAIACKRAGKPYVLNAIPVEVHGTDEEYVSDNNNDDEFDNDDNKSDDKKITYSYIDINGIISGRKNIEDAFLVNSATLNDDNTFVIGKELGIGRDVGVSLEVDYTKQFDINKILESEKAILPSIEYVPNKVFEEKVK